MSRWIQVGLGCLIINLCSMLLPAGAATSSESPADLTFEARVRAQEAIERVYHGRRIDAPEFDVAVPREVLDDKVRKFLRQSQALERQWKTRVTSYMLDRELLRMIRESRDPERLRELFAALGNDRLVIRECLARPILVDRLVRNFFSPDQEIHSEARLEAETLRRVLVDGNLDPAANHPRRAVLQRAVRPTPEAWNAQHPTEPPEPAMDPEAFARWRAQFPEAPGNIGPVTETDRSFEIRVVLTEEPGQARGAVYTVPKQLPETSWDRFEAAPVTTAAAADSELPELRVTGDCGPEHWRTQGASPSPRFGHTAVWTGAEMIILGPGESGGSRYDPATDTWAAMRYYGQPFWEGFSAVWTGTEMIVWGGRTLPGGPPVHLNTGARYDPVADSWVSISTDFAPEGRFLHTAIWTGEEMIVWGGATYTHETFGWEYSYFSSGGRYDPVNDHWEPRAWDAPEGRADHTAVWTGTEMIVWGGYSDSTEEYFGDGARYDPTGDVWTPVATSGAPSGRMGHSGIWTGEEMIIWGGRNSSQTLHDGGRYDPVSDAWSSMTSASSPSARSDHETVWTGNKMIVWGGSDDGTDFNDGSLYDPGTDSWTSTSLVTAPDPRNWTTSVWTGAQMIVWGGGTYHDGHYHYFESGARYDPASDRWTPTSTSGIWDAELTGHSGIWTGNEMVVWGGGLDAAHRLNTGSVYNPTTAVRTPTSLANAPARRGGHTAVWTGTEMIAWGGVGDQGSLNTGGRYDPVADTWTSTSMGTGVPTARLRHAAVWTGSEMIVWGGTVGLDYVDTGARLDPLSGTWTATSTVGAAQPRRRYTTIWTGSEMIVWGGEDHFGYSIPAGGGARYDPLADSWSPVSSENAPERRKDHTAVWTGEEMIVWGGRNNVVTLEGGRYDPDLDRWTEVPRNGQSLGRGYHTAVWTGDEMIVWGGVNDLGDHQHGGYRYTPTHNLWVPITSENAPTARAYHVAVWTGRLMIVWGGEDTYYDWNDDPHPGSVELGVFVHGDADGDGLCGADDCDPFNPNCGVDCTDSDDDGFCVTSDCDEANAYCTSDCTDVDSDGFCVPHDCYDGDAACVFNCIDDDGDGLPVCGGDCDDTNPRCTVDCTDGDLDGYCVIEDCDDANPDCATDCTDADGDGICVTTDCDDLVAECAFDCGDGDSDGFRDCDADCDALNPQCNTDCTDDDLDGYCVTSDCDDSKPYCTEDCTDADADGYCILQDCDDASPGCIGIDCSDSDGDGVRVCEDDCDDLNPNCEWDCTDSDVDGYCVTTDCDDSKPFCATDCTDADTDGHCVGFDCDDTLPECALDCSDDDSDGLPACLGDCDDTNPEVLPGHAEICTDNADNNCDGLKDAAAPECEGLVASALSFTANDTMVWTAAATADSHGLYRGSIPVSGFAGYDHLCEATSLTDSTAVDPDLPGRNSAFYYLVAGQGQDHPGDRFTGGPLGVASSGESRPTSNSITCGPLLHVDPDVVLEGGEGLTWATAYSSVALALDHAAFQDRGAEVWVRGSVNETGAELPVISRPSVRLLGGFDGSEAVSWERSPETTPTVWSGQGGLLLFQAVGTSVVLDGLTMRDATSVFVGNPAGRLTEITNVIIESVSGNAVDLILRSPGVSRLMVRDATFASGGLCAIRAIAEAGQLTGRIEDSSFSDWSEVALRLEARPLSSAEVRVDIVSNRISGGGGGIVLGAHANDLAGPAIQSSFVGSNLVHNVVGDALTVEATGYFDFNDGVAHVEAAPLVVGNTFVDAGGDGVACVAERTDLTVVPHLHTVNATPQLWDNLITHNTGAGISETLDDPSTNLVADPIVVGNGLHGNSPLYRDEGTADLTLIVDVNALGSAVDNFDGDPRYVDRAAQDYHLAFGTVLGFRSGMRYLANDSDPGLGLLWTQPGFDDSGWTGGLYGVGFDTGASPNAAALLLTKVPPTSVSVYTRIPFEVDDVSRIDTLLLDVDWDDGFAVWLNGVEVFRSETVPAGPLDWNTTVGEHESSNNSTPIYTEYDISTAGVPLLVEGENLLAVAVWNVVPSGDLVLVPRLILQQESPAVDSGHPDAPRSVIEDMEGDPRPNDSDRDGISRPDVGADERR